MDALNDGVRQIKRILRRLRVRGRVRYLNAMAVLRRDSDLTIRWRSLKAVPGKPLSIKLLNIAYRRIEDVFGEYYAGFTNCLEYCGKELKPDLVQLLQSHNPPEHNSINFLCFERTNETSAGHTILASFDSKDKIISLYDGGKCARENPVTERVKTLLEAHYGHIVGAQAGYCLNYCVQKDKWTCTYRSIYACLAILHGKRPENYHPRIMEVFKIVKKALEDDGIRLKAMSLEEIWKKISREKRTGTVDDIDDCKNDL